MRADRLVQLLMSLQRRPGWTAGALARELGVCERTIYRDLDALSSSGVPVVTSRGVNGGVALLEGWRTQLTGLTRPELHALAALGPATALEDLGLGGPLRSGLLKVAAALPALQQPTLEHARQRLHFDGSPGFFAPREPLPLLPRLRDALWQDLEVQVRYRDFEGREDRRTLHPYALVAKGDRWYLVAGAADGTLPRVFRVSRISWLRVSGRRFRRPERFDLPVFWVKWRRRFSDDRPDYEVTLRLDTQGRELLRAVRPPSDHPLLDQARPERGGRRWRVTVDFERESIALSQLCTLSRGVEVLAPASLRERLRLAGQALVATYDSGPGAGPDEPGALSRPASAARPSGRRRTAAARAPPAPRGPRPARPGSRPAPSR